MSKIAIVVQRCHPDIVGGSESLAWHYATLLGAVYQVEVLTTTARDTRVWANTLPEGLEVRDGVTIRRFAVSIGRSRYWEKIYQRLLADFKTGGLGRKNGRAQHLAWPLGLQEEFIRYQGPYSASLLLFLKQKWADYRGIIFVTYLYPPTYFGIFEVPAGRALFAPTLHDEEPAYLSAYKNAAHRARAIIWLTDAERRVGVDLWGELPGRVVSMAIDTRPRPAAKMNFRYLLYSGRIDPNKGSTELFEYFTRFKREHPSNLRLLLTGIDDIRVPRHRDIRFLGMVPVEEKFRLMAGATAFVMPSAKESFSIVTLEAMAQRTPVLAYSGSAVIVDHIRESGGGRIYSDYPSFEAGLTELLSGGAHLKEMTDAGQRYVAERYTVDRVRDALVDVIRRWNP